MLKRCTRSYSRRKADQPRGIVFTQPNGVNYISIPLPDLYAPILLEGGWEYIVLATPALSAPGGH